MPRPIANVDGMIKFRSDRMLVNGYGPVGTTSAKHNRGIRHERVFEDEPVTESCSAGTCASLTEKRACSSKFPSSGLISDGSDGRGRVLGTDGHGERLGGVSAPSLTRTVIVAVPDWFAAGVTVTVRFDPLPPTRCPNSAPGWCLKKIL